MVCRLAASCFPFLALFFPAYCLSALFILSPVFFDPLMQAEWLSDLPKHDARVLLSATTMGTWLCWIPGALVWTVLADRYGRRPAALGSAMGALLISVITVGAWSFASFAVLRSVLGLFMGGQGACAFCLVKEWHHPKETAWVMFGGNVGFSLAMAFLALVAFASIEQDVGLGWRSQRPCRGERHEQHARREQHCQDEPNSFH